MKNKLALIFFASTFALTACQKGDPMPDDTSINQSGLYNTVYTRNLKGFPDVRTQLLNEKNITPRDFILWSTDSAWALKQDQQLQLKSLRDAVVKPGSEVLLQKIIPLEEITVYMNNTYGGTIGGFVAVAGDVRALRTMNDVFLGMRLDYPGTKFLKNGAGYGVLRFFSPSADRFIIPYCSELGGTQPHAWPNGGGGFTTSLLADGGYPEWKALGYDAPRPGAELYEVTPEGREVLRATYKTDKWETFEDPKLPTKINNSTNIIRNGTYTTKSGATEFVQTVCTYQNRTFTVLALVDGCYHLTTDTCYDELPLQTIEKGIWGIDVPADQITDLKEISL